ncbi:hypothetical protein [Pontibacter burrus]|uniref:ApeA N-terminal domain-containing protein n=1 Tax=Pontibacter burrus TaxID=2704466 RepID=A0A6B3LWL7_9BACT|nr:hypothetical protein [Pontibacter burrus]NEM98706.1 hypothetical protein [Pontibacter burrus]
MVSETLAGKGHFHFDGQTIEREFKLVIYPRQTFIEINAIPIEGFLKKCKWKFEGYLFDGTRIESNNLFPIGIGNSELYVNEFAVGERSDVANTSLFTLTGYYKCKFYFNYAGYEISVTEEKDVTEEKKFYKRTGIIREGVQLSLKKQNHVIVDSFEIADSITKLLSISTGNDVVFNKRNYDDLYVVHRRPLIDSSSFDNVIPYEWMGKYIESTLPIWNKLEAEDKKLITNIASYLNFAGGSGYLDERMFKVAQGWEMAASKWGRKVVTSSESILNLRKLLKATLKEWRSNYPELDKDGFLNSRILRSLEWDSFINNIENLVRDFKIDTTKIDLNFKLLKNNVRDKVAHEGRMVPFDNAYSLLESLKFGLRLVILKKLQYQGDVFYHENNFTRNFKISYFFQHEEKQV